MAKSASAARRIRRSIVPHGFRLSDRLIAQKSCPSGAPARALAASARAGAPLGHDFCAINLSDNLKPWGTIERRIRLAAEADFAIAFYNPRSKSRPDTLDDAFAVLRATCRDARPVLFARAVSTPDEMLAIVPLPDARGAMADMRTMVIVGSSQTRIIARPVAPILYTPRSAS